MIRTSQFGQLVLGLLVAFAGSATLRATDIKFDLSNSGSGMPSFSQTVSSYTITLTPIGTGANFEFDSDGLYIGSSTEEYYVNGFQIQVTGGSLSFLNYEVGYISELAAEPFVLTGGTGASSNNPLSSVGIFSYNGSYSITPSQTVTLTSTGTTADNLSQIKFMTFTVVPVPEPSTYALAAIATGLMAAIARRRRA